MPEVTLFYLFHGFVSHPHTGIWWMFFITFLKKQVTFLVQHVLYLCLQVLPITIKQCEGRNAWTDVTGHQCQSTVLNYGQWCATYTSICHLGIHVWSELLACCWFNTEVWRRVFIVNIAYTAILQHWANTRLCCQKFGTGQKYCAILTATAHTSSHWSLARNNTKCWL